MYYKIVRTDDYCKDRNESIKEFERRVNNSIEAGFKPIGGLCIDGDVEGQFFYQAMIDEGNG